MKIRLIGQTDDVAYAERAIRAVFIVHTISADYIGRGGTTRVYIEATPRRDLRGRVSAETPDEIQTVQEDDYAVFPSELSGD